MTQEQINRSEMLDAVKTYMDTHTTIWSPVPIIGTFLGELYDITDDIANHKEAQLAAQVFLHKNKKIQKKMVAEKADMLNDSLFAYAGVIEDPVLENKSDKNMSDFFRLANDNFATEIKETVTLLEKHLPQLADYGINKGQIKDLKSSFDTFLQLNGMPRQYRISSKVATETLDELFEKSNLVLTKKLDKVMKRYKNSNPTFYKGYLAAREVVNN